MGSGKTLWIVMIAYTSKKKIISNFKLNFPYEPFSLAKFINQEYEDCIILLDEAYRYLDSRISGSEVNRKMSYILFQSRKKGVEIYTTEQLNRSIDLRYRELSEYDIICNGLIGTDFVYTIYCRYRKVKVVNRKIPYKKAMKLFGLYDTNEIVGLDEEYASNIKFYTQQEKIELIDQIKEELYRMYQPKYPTMLDVKNYLFKQNYPSDWRDFIYSELKLKIKNENLPDKKKTKKKSSKKSKSKKSVKI